MIFISRFLNAHFGVQNVEKLILPMIYHFKAINSIYSLYLFGTKNRETRDTFSVFFFFIKIKYFLNIVLLK
jgi:hypothetical protein